MSGRGGRRVCDFFLRGSCKFGDSCRNEHPAPANSYNGRTTDSRTTSNSQPARPRDGAQALPYNLSKDSIIADLKDEKPIWPFSAYGPGKNAPRQLFEGYPLEQSFEELRMAYYRAQAAGNTQPAIQAEQELLSKAQQQTEQALSNVDAAIQYVIDGANQHPNRLDMVQDIKGPNTSTQTPVNPFGNPTSSQGGFGAPSVTNQPSAGPPKPAFGTPAFGQPSAPQSAFGQTSNSGVAAAGFGQPSALGSGSQAVSAFGQPSMPSGAPQPSAFGQSSLPSGTSQSSAFGRPSMPGTTPAFAAPGFSANASPFAQNAVTKGISPFAQMNNSASNNPDPSAATPQQSNSTPFRQAAERSSTFSSPFGGSQPQNSAASPFGAANQQAQASSNGFGLVSNPAPGPFGQISAPAAPSAFSAMDVSSSAPPQPVNGVIANSHAHQPSSNYGVPDPSTYIQYDRNKNIRSFKGQPVRYIDQEPHYRDPRTGKDVRIWFPDGPPAVPNRYGEEPPEVYAAAGQALEDAYRHVAETGVFKDGLMPEIAPKAEWIRYDI